MRSQEPAAAAPEPSDTASEHQRDLRRALRAALDNGTVRPARFQSDALASELIPPPDEDE